MASRKLDKSEWRAFCDHLSKALLGSDSEAVNASLSVGEEVAAEWVVLLGVAYDPRSDSFDMPSAVSNTGFESQRPCTSTRV